MPKAPSTPGDGDGNGDDRKRPRKPIDWKKLGANKNSDDSDRAKWASSAIGDGITGTLVRVEEVNTRFGPKVLVELDECSGVIAGGAELPDGDYVVWTTPGLINALDDCEAGELDRVIIELDDLVDTGKGNPFKAYTAAVSF